MSLIIATGSNQGNSEQFLLEAHHKLEEIFKPIKASRLYKSAAVDYLDQPDFYNQVLEFELPDMAPREVVQTLLAIEKEMGRIRKTDKGPRTIDIDLIFYGLEQTNDDVVTVPHPRLFQRSFVVKPLSELPYFEILKQHFTFSSSFDVDANPI